MKIVVHFDAAAFNAEFETATVGPLTLRSRFNFSRSPSEELVRPFFKVLHLSMEEEVFDNHFNWKFPVKEEEIPDWAIERVYDMHSYKGSATLFYRTFMSPTCSKERALKAVFGLMLKHTRITT